MKKILAFITLIGTTFTLIAQTNIEININNNSVNQAVVIDGTTNKIIKMLNIKDKKVAFSLDVQQPNLYVLKFNNNAAMWLILSPEEKNVKINYDFNSFRNTSVSGSKCTEVYVEAMRDIEQQPTTEEKIDAIDKSINDNPGCLTSVLFAINIMNYPGHQKTHENLIASLDSMKDLPIVKSYINMYQRAKKTAIGAIAPEIELPDTNGTIQKLSNFRGKYVLVDFWAAWCRPCRAESPNIVAAYNKYHNKGFTIFSVSLDMKKEDWLNAIHKDKLQQWTHVSDLKGWKSDAAAKYGVNAIPSNFLLDPQGKIIAKNLRGNKLEEKLAEIFNKK